MLQFYANPYDLDRSGFYFSDLEEFEEKAKRSGAEEFEIEFIDGDDFERDVSQHVNQGNLQLVLDVIDHGLDEWEEVAVLWLADDYSDLEYAFLNYRDVSVSELAKCWTADEARAEYAQEFHESIGELSVSSSLAMYIDWERVGLDMELNGVFHLYELNGKFYALSM